MDAPVDYHLAGHAAWLTLNSPENHNALSNALCMAFNEALKKAVNEPRARVIVLTGTGKSFCAGADLKGSGGGAVGEAQDAPPPFVNSMEQLWNCPKPVIGRIQGSAFGGGLGLLAACDIALVADTAQFAFTEVRLGLSPNIISVFVLRKAPLARLTPLFLSGRRFGPHQAKEMGLASEVVPADELDDAVSALIGELGACGPNALKEVKTLLRTVPGLPIAEGLEWAWKTNRRQFTSDEAKEGMQAFAEKRKPSWVE